MLIIVHQYPYHHQCHNFNDNNHVHHHHHHHFHDGGDYDEMVLAVCGGAIWSQFLDQAAALECGLALVPTTMRMMMVG